MACAPSEDSDQPGHPPSLIRDFAVRMKKAWVLSYPLSALQRLIRLCGCQADLSLRRAHMPFCCFCHKTAHMSSKDTYAIMWLNHVIAIHVTEEGTVKIFKTITDVIALKVKSSCRSQDFSFRDFQQTIIFTFSNERSLNLTENAILHYNINLPRPKYFLALIICSHFL